MAEEKLRGDLGGAIAFPNTDPNGPQIPEAILRLQPKSSEEKIYLVLFYRTDEDECLFHLGVGREDAYMAIERMCNTYPIDILKSIVLVEVPAIDRFGKGTYMLKAPEDAASVYAFCKSVEKYFANLTDFNIEEFNSENNDAENDRRPEQPAFPIPQVVSSGDQMVAEAYAQEIQGGQHG